MSHQFDGWLAGLVNDRHTRDMRIRAGLPATPAEPAPVIVARGLEALLATSGQQVDDTGFSNGVL